MFERITVIGMMWFVAAAAALFAGFRNPACLPSVIVVENTIRVAIVTLRRWRYEVSTGRVVGLAVAALALPVAVTALINTIHWGFAFTRPGLDRRMADVCEVKTISVVRTIINDQGRVEFAAWPSSAVAGILSRVPQDLDESSGARVLVALRSRGLLPSNPVTIPIDVRSRLHEILESKGLVVPNRWGDLASRYLSGVVVEATGSSGEPLLFFAMKGAGATRGSVAYSELLFEGDARSSNLILVSSRRFACHDDIKSHLIWPIIFPIIASATLLAGMILERYVPWAGRRRGLPVRSVGQRSSAA